MSYVGNTPTQQAFSPAIDYFSGNGSTVAFTLSRPVASVAQVQVTVNNVAQNPTDAFTVNGNTITFTSAPPSGTSNIYVYYTSPITQVIAPSDGTVGTGALMNGAVTTAKLSSTTGTGAVALASLPVFTTTLGVGGATPSASGAGITFPATQLASSDANTLDDYEEGTWTPTFTAGTTNPTVTYQVNLGSYVKIGKLVYVSCRLRVATVSGGSGTLFISGLPFGGLASDSSFGAGSLAYKNGWLTNGPNEFRLYGATSIECYYQTATAESSVTPANLQASADVIVNMSYQTT